MVGATNVVSWAEERGEVGYGDPGQEKPRAGSDFLNLLGVVLTRLVQNGPAATDRNLRRVTRFHAIRPPLLSITDYLKRLSKYYQCSDESFVLALIYMDRIVKRHPNFGISVYNIHRLLCTAVMLGAKFFDDSYYSNAHYAKVGGIQTQEMNGLEVTFVSLIKWQLAVSPEEYDQYRRDVMQVGVQPPQRCVSAARSIRNAEAHTEGSDAGEHEERVH